jgi:hypothetical protein
MILNRSTAVFIVSFFVAVTLLGVLIFLVYSIRSKNREASELINTADRIAEATVLAESIENIQADAGPDLEALSNLALSSDKLIFFIESVEGVGRKLKLDINISSVERIEDKKAAEEPVFRMVLDTQGSWLSTFAFLRALESLPYRVMVEEINLFRAEVGWQAKVVLSIHTFD